MSKFNKMSVLSLALAFLASGCIVRTYTVVKDRPDIEIKGNQGYLAGTPSEKKEVENKTRTTYVTEIELGASHEEQVLVGQNKQDKAAKKVVKQSASPVVGKGVVSAKDAKLEKKDALTAVPAKKGDTVVIVGKQEAQPVVSVAQEKVKEKVKKVSTYVVKSGDTLEKIAARPEVYGDKKQWYKIFKANESKLKEPNKILPGQVLDIP